MAMQAGMGLSKVLFLVGAGFTGSIVLRNGKLSEILSELQTLLKEKSGDRSTDESDHGDALANQVRRLASEVRHLASAHPIAVLNGNSGNMTSLLVPAATVGALGYGYMWWKGISFSDLMYVTKRNMANAVSSMTKHLEQVSAALAATKKHLTQRIQNLDDKLDEQKEMSVEIKNEVTDARNKLENIGLELNSLQQLVWGLNGKVDAMEDKQDFTCAGISYICNFIGERGAKLPDYLQEMPKPSGKRLYVNYGEKGSLKGLQHIAEAIEAEIPDGSKIDAVMQNDFDSNIRKGVSRTASIKW
ncbi:hypothetical protein J5N97_019265 [Dioscorea zingiberensis]|uniref:DUF1664 domain-containing protein n=1 Tax=Dioscorea zingiberensis TaxID=325984 RepID=A0A9D5CDP6_9LILI|nr:hypothetical protein J5N97_019265 [Dioscorea zingiberensis]